MIFDFGKSRRRRELESLLDEDLVGLLEPGVEVDGRLSVSTGLLRLNTHVKGTILSEGTVIVAEQAEIEGEIHSRVLSVTGKVKGAVHASECLEINQHGVVLGDIYTPCLVVDAGGYFDGECHMPLPEPERHTPDGVDSKDSAP
jgi:cytoskeletal protein CcmA (bactofilin family)